MHVLKSITITNLSCFTYNLALSCFTYTEYPDPVADPVPGSSLITIKGRNKGEQKVHDGYVYSHNKTNASNGNPYWLCKVSKKYSPTCKGRLTTNGGQVIKATPHYHEPSETDAGIQIFLFSIRAADVEETIPPASRIRRLIYAAPDSVQASLPDKRCLRKQLSERRRCARGYPLTQRTTMP